MAGQSIELVGAGALDNYRGDKKGKKGKKGKKRGRGGIELADSVNDMLYEGGSIVAFQKLYFGGQLAQVDTNDTIPAEKKTEAKRNTCLKFLGCAILARRLLKGGGLGGAMSKAVFSVAAVNLANNI